MDDLHAGAGGLDRGDVGVEAVDRVDDGAELRVAQVRVDLGGVRGAGGGEAERLHGPVQVRGLVGLAQRQELAQGGLVHLDDLDAGGFEVGDLVAQGQGHLVGGLAERLVVADERPGEDRDRAGEHALHRLAGQGLRVPRPTPP